MIFLAAASRVSQKFWGSYRLNFSPDSVRASKNLQFGHQFHQNRSIQSRDILVNVKNIKIATAVLDAERPQYPLIFEMLSNLDK